MFQIGIIGGGLAGLVSAIELSRAGFKVVLFEKGKYPTHKVCGEYISNEVKDYLIQLGVPVQSIASSIDRLRITSSSGITKSHPLSIGGFGMSRSLLDGLLFQIALDSGATVMQDSAVVDVVENEGFEIILKDNSSFKADLVIGAFGKRSILDKRLDRNFMQERTGFVAVKYHIKTDYPKNEIGIDCFRNGYSGIVKIEDDLYNLCYLIKRDLSQSISIPEIEDVITRSSKYLRYILNNCEHVFSRPLVINEVNFSAKNLNEKGLLMAGDSASLITPICGNGMSMAIRSGHMISSIICNESVRDVRINKDQRERIGKAYTQMWNREFKSRLRFGRAVHPFVLQPLLSDLIVAGLHLIPYSTSMLIRASHGTPLTVA